MIDENTLRRGCEALGIILTDEQVRQFLTYYEFLVEKNQVMNLTAITEYEEVVQKHFVDSLSIVKVCDMKQVQTLIDVGTGAGFPGVPIKIAFPHIKVVLLDSLNKRVQFLNELTGRLGCEEITAVHGRAEDFGKNPAYREQFDLCVSRAVANLSSLSEYCVPFINEKGGAGGDILFAGKRSGAFFCRHSERTSDSGKVSAQGRAAVEGTAWEWRKEVTKQAFH